MSVLTPLEPAMVPPGREPRGPAATLQHASFVTPAARLDLAAASCRGKRHPHNEDAHSALDRRTPVYVVADGVGGGAMAACASRELVRHVHAALDASPIDDEAVRATLLDADRAVARRIARDTAQVGAATVALCASVEAALSSWIVAWVGDCRVYRIAGDGATRAELLTRDDSYRHLREIPPPGSMPDDPARMIGNGAVGTPNVIRVDLADAETLVLCSDGVHRHVDAEDLACLAPRSTAPLARRCLRLVALARRRGSEDDATLLAVQRTVLRGSSETGVEPRPRNLLARLVGGGS
jgi:protein phosphatase